MTLRISLAFLRRSGRRLIGTGVAIALGAAFIATTFILMGTFQQAAINSVSARFGQADLVLTPSDAMSFETLQALGAVPGVKSYAPLPDTGVTLTSTDSSEWLYLQEMPSDPSLLSSPLSEGTWPSGDNEIALPSSVASRLGLGIGDTVDASIDFWVYSDPPTTSDGALSGEAVTTDGSQSFTITSGDAENTGDEYGTVHTTHHSLTMTGIFPPQELTAAALGTYGVASSSIVHAIAQESYGDTSVSYPYYGDIGILVEPGHSTESVREAINNTAIGTAISLEDWATNYIGGATGDFSILAAIAFAFATVAMLVAGMVVANTFHVLVAQRTRDLALLRCVGATPRQLMTAVLIEAGILSLVASTAGVLLGVVLGQGGVVALGSYERNSYLPTTISITPLQVMIPIAMAFVVTMISAGAPARAATRVAPITALNAIPKAPTLRSSRTRLIASAAMVVVGVAFISSGLWIVARDRSSYNSIFFGVIGGVFLICGAMLSAIFLVPWAIKAIRATFGRFSLTTRLAAQNAERNPRRVASSATALLIGVALVTMMVVGASSTVATMNSTLGRVYPVDLSVSSNFSISGSSATKMPQTLIDQLSSDPNIDGSTTLKLASGSMYSTIDQTWYPIDFVGVDVATAQTTLNDPEALDNLRDGVALAPYSMGWAVEFGTETIFTNDVSASGVTPSTGDAVKPDEAVVQRSMTVFPARTPGNEMIMTMADFNAMMPQSTSTELWLSLAPDVNVVAAIDQIQMALNDSASGSATAVPEADGASVSGAFDVGTTVLGSGLPSISIGDSNASNFYISGAAVERASFTRVIDLLLLVVTALILVAVVIALIGVANTLSLSILERRKEIGTMRALGMTRRTLAGTLASEGTMIAGVGAGAGLILGVFLGGAGARILLGGMLASVTIDIPWLRLVFVLLIALAAGLVASILPSIRASRMSPVKALGE